MDFGTARTNLKSLNNSYVLSNRSEVPEEVSKRWVQLETIARDARHYACSALKETRKDDPTLSGVKEILEGEYKLDQKYVDSLMRDLENGYET